MADRNTIVQRITLEGADAIIKALSSMGEAGEKAFNQLKEAASGEQLQKVSDTFNKIGEAGKAVSSAIGGVGENFGRFGEATLSVVERVTAISAVVAAAGVSVLGLARSAGLAANAVQDQAQAMGLTIETYQRLQFAADQAGVSQKQFTTGLNAFSKAIQATAADQKKTVIDLASDVAAALGGDTFNTVRTGQIQSALDNVLPAAKQIQAQLKALGSDVSLESVITQLRNMALNSEAARVKLTELGAQVPAATLTEALDRAKKGIGDLSLVSNSASQALSKMGISVLDASGKTRETGDVLADVAEKFAALPDGAEKTATAMALFGRLAGPNLIPLLNQGRAGLSGISEEMKKLGGGFDTTQVKAGKDMVDAFSRLEFAVTAAKNQLGIIFTPILTQAADLFTKAVVNNFSTIKEWAIYLGGEAKQIILDFIATLSGEDGKVQNAWILRWRDNVISFASTLKTAIQGTVIPAFTAIGEGADWVAGKVNGFFGTDYSGKGLLLVAALGAITGAFGLIGPAITLAASLVFGFFTLLAANPFVLLVGAALALGAAIVLVAMNVGGLRDKLVELVTSAPGAAWQWIVDTYNAADRKVGDAMGRLTTAIISLVSTAAAGAWQWIVDTFLTAASALGTHIAEIATALATLVTTSIGGAWQWLGDSFDSVIDGIKSKFQSVVDFIRNLGSSVGSFFGIGQGSGPSGARDDGSGSGQFAFAGGGHVRGPGTGTSDSILVRLGKGLARLSNGEFVQRSAAVQHYGLDFMNAVNSLQFRLPQFNLGGLVDGFSAALAPRPLLPSFATGGLVAQPRTASGLHPLTLNFGNGRRVGGLFAAPDAVESLRRTAMLEQISSTGRKSSTT